MWNQHTELYGDEVEYPKLGFRVYLVAEEFSFFSPKLLTYLTIFQPPKHAAKVWKRIKYGENLGEMEKSILRHT